MNNTLSIVPSEGATNEFPVLKAFQEYIDAEQAKARKRMLGLSVFFIVLLIVVVATFVLVLTTVINRNQALSDRLLDYALKEHEKTPIVQNIPAPVVAPQPSAQEILKPFIERLEREQIAMKEAYEKQRKEAETQRKETEEKVAAREAARDAELRKVRAELEKERERTKKENDRQEAIERHRRRLYPDYYRLPSQPESVPQTFTPATASKPPPSQPKAPSSALPATPSTPPSTSTEKPLSKIKPITYFNLDDDDGVPFILETPTTPSPQKKE